MIPAIASTSLIYPNVQLGKDVTIEDYCIIGAPFLGYEGQLTVIGDGAVIRSHTVIYAGNIIGHSFQAGNKANIRELNRIGDQVSVGTLTVVEHHSILEDGVRIHSQAFVPEYSTLEHGAWIGPNVVLTNAKYPKAPNVKAQLQGPRVKRNAKIGANATLLPGIEIGENALVGAGSVVTRDVKPGTIVAGNPARVIGTVSY